MEFADKDIKKALIADQELKKKMNMMKREIEDILKKRSNYNF